MTSMLRAYVDEHKPWNWDEYLGLITYAYNSSFNVTVANTPCILMMGRDPPLPVDELVARRAAGGESDAPAEFVAETIRVLELA